jgi:NADPH2:quinone reductase
MRKVVATSLDSIADYRIVETERPRPGSGEILLKVAACGVGYVDALVALGRYQVKPPLPHTPGQEVAGWVAEIGTGVAALKVGDRVVTRTWGSFAEYVRAPAAATWRLPDQLALAQAAGFYTNYVTAIFGLQDRARLAEGETVLVFGAAGGLGAAGLQVAKRLGARVLAVASSEEKRAFCMNLGCDAALDTQIEGWRERLLAACGGQGPDVVFDPVCGPLFEPAFRSLSWRGRHLVLGFAGGPIPALPVNLTLMKGAALIGVDVRQLAEREPDHARADFKQLLRWASDGLAPPVGRRFPLEAFAEALEFALSGQGVGKTVLEIAEAP